MTAKRKPATKSEIYALIDPRDGAIRYIGKANDSAKRLKSHIRDARRRRTPVYDWLNKLMAMGLAPSVVILETCEDWIEAEKRHIAQARAQGMRLLNVAEGGNEPYCSPETRAANGRNTKGRVLPYPNIRRVMFKLSLHLRDKRRSPLATPEKIKAYTDKIAHIRSRIERARRCGWIDRLEAAYGVYLEAINDGTPSKIAAEKARQTITISV